MFDSTDRVAASVLYSDSSEPALFWLVPLSWAAHSGRSAEARLIAKNPRQIGGRDGRGRGVISTDFSPVAAKNAFERLTGTMARR